ncbi:unnamed protein product, partial [marine sediment metagenome]
CLLAEVRPIARHYCLSGCAALAHFALKAVDATMARTKMATLQ